MDYYEVSEARHMKGLRLVLSAGVPGPWGEAAKGLFQVRGVPFIPVAQVPAQANSDLVAWTGVRNAPVAVYEDEAPRTSWLDILMLAQRLGDGPPLLPADPYLRALAIGISHEICGQWGYGWCRRLMIFARLWGEEACRNPGELPPDQRQLARQYDFRPETLASAPQRLRDILRMLNDRLEAQRQMEHCYLVGDSLTAADIYWATFSAMLEPLPHDLNPMPDELRDLYADQGDAVDGIDTAPLIEHRDFIYRNHLKLPLDF